MLAGTNASSAYCCLTRNTTVSNASTEKMLLPCMHFMHGDMSNPYTTHPLLGVILQCKFKVHLSPDGATFGLPGNNGTDTLTWPRKRSALSSGPWRAAAPHASPAWRQGTWPQVSCQASTASALPEARCPADCPAQHPAGWTAGCPAPLFVVHASPPPGCRLDSAAALQHKRHEGV